MKKCVYFLGAVVCSVFVSSAVGSTAEEDYIRTDWFHKFGSPGNACDVLVVRKCELEQGRRKAQAQKESTSPEAFNLVMENYDDRENLRLRQLECAFIIERALKTTEASKKDGAEKIKVIQMATLDKIEHEYQERRIKRLERIKEVLGQNANSSTPIETLLPDVMMNPDPDDD